MRNITQLRDAHQEAVKAYIANPTHENSKRCENLSDELKAIEREIGCVTDPQRGGYYPTDPLTIWQRFIKWLKSIVNCQ